MPIPESFLEELNSRTDILDLVSSYVSLTKKGNKYWGLCPFHSEKTPSFSFHSFVPPASLQLPNGLHRLLVGAAHRFHRLVRSIGHALPQQFNQNAVRLHQPV